MLSCHVLFLDCEGSFMLRSGRASILGARTGSSSTVRGGLRRQPARLRGAPAGAAWAWAGRQRAPERSGAGAAAQVAVLPALVPFARTMFGVQKSAYWVRTTKQPPGTH